MLAVRGEKETFAFVKNEVLKGNVPYERESLIRRIQELAPEEKYKREKHRMPSADIEY